MKSLLRPLGSSAAGVSAGAGIAALTGHHRQEDGQDGQLGDDALEEGHDRRRQKGRGQIHMQPGQAFAQRKGNAGKGFFIAAGPEHLLNIAGRVLLNAVDHPFGFDDSQDMPLAIHYRGGKILAAGQFGSGWAWLGVKDDGSLCVCSTPNQDSPLMKGIVDCACRPILGLDSRHLLEIVLESGPGAYLVPAHVWTPWFAENSWTAWWI